MTVWTFMPAIARVVGFWPGCACSDWVSSRSTSARAGSPLGRNITKRMLSEEPTIFGLSIEPHLKVTNGGAEPPPPPPPASIIFSSFIASSLMDASAPFREASSRSWTRIVHGMPPPNSGFGVSVPVTGLIVQTLVLVIEYSCGLNAHSIGSPPSTTSCARSKFCGSGIAQPIFSPEWAMSRDSVARPWLAAAMAGPDQRTGKASVKLQERLVVPSWVVSSTVISLSSACSRVFQNHSCSAFHRSCRRRAGGTGSGRGRGGGG